jgi:aminoglycoside phosphotransferase (APT) family kinase protein
MLNATATAYVCLQVLSQEPEDHHAVAVSCHDDTPGQDHRSRNGRDSEVKSQAELGVLGPGASGRSGAALAAGSSAGRGARAGPALGDARIGNIIYTGGGVAAVLDWELATLGQPEEDLA